MNFFSKPRAACPPMAPGRRAFVAGSIAAVAALGIPRRAPASSLDRLGLDFAYYNPPSLILKSSGKLEAALKSAGTEVDWVLSLGSNKANGFLAANVVQFGSTAGSAALLARANGSPIRTVFLYSQPEWTALVIGKDSPLRTVADLRGKKIAATKGTDPYFFLLRALKTANLQQSDVEIVELQHPDGRLALERGQVDAWAGLDPHMAASELDAGSKLLYRNIAFNSFGALNVREDFLHDHPDVVAIVLEEYGKAHEFARTNVAETAKIVADASGLEQRVTERQLTLRTKYPDPIPGAAYRDALAGVVPIVRDNALALPGADLDGALVALIDPDPARSALRA
jgi:sulfonate transport system substrate-binding protein